MGDGGYRLGIDIGTTYVGAALHRDGRAEILSLGANRTVMPSVVYVGAEGSTLVGDAAERRAISEPDRVARGFKRRVGDPTPIIVGGQAWSPARLTAELIQAVVAASSEVEGAPPEYVALCHPATWGPYKLAVYEEAATSLGLHERTFVPEPAAAAIHYASVDRIDVGRVVAVYDLGGGTFDATVLRRGEAGFELLGQPAGLDSVGGVDFDEAVFAHVATAVGDRLTDLDHDDPDVLAAIEALRERCQEAKEALSSEVEAVIPVALPSGFTTVRIIRDEYEDHIRSSIDATVRAMRQALGAADVAPEDVDRILLVGGASRTPLVAEMLSSAFGRPLALDAHPKHSVALGAARAAGAAATDDVGALFAAVTSEIKVVDAPVAALALDAPPRVGRKALLIALSSAAVVLALLAGLLVTRRNGGGEPIASRGGDSDSSTSSESGVASGESNSATNSDTGSSASLDLGVPAGGGNVGGGGGNGGGGGTQSTTSPNVATTASTAVPITSPGTVSGVVVKNPSGNDATQTVQLSWSVPSNTGGQLLGYKVRWTAFTSGGAVAGPVEVSTASTSGSFSASNGTNFASSWIRWEVAAFNNAGTSAYAAATGIVPNIKGQSFSYARVRAIGGRAEGLAPEPCDQATDTGCRTEPGSGTSISNGQQVNIAEQS